MPHVYSLKTIDYATIPSPHKIYGLLTSKGLWNDAGAKQLSFDIRKLPAGKYSFPYHYHHAAEELFYIISGKAKLRLPEGISLIEAGDLIHFESGPNGAHQLFNDSVEPLVYLDIRVILPVDVITYPDTGKTGILPALKMFQGEGNIDYWEGEDAPERYWDK